MREMLAVPIAPDLSGVLPFVAVSFYPKRLGYLAQASEIRLPNIFGY